MAEETESNVMEVELIDVRGNTYIYWLRKQDLPYPDDIDSAIKLSVKSLRKI